MQLLLFVNTQQSTELDNKDTTKSPVKNDEDAIEGENPADSHYKCTVYSLDEYLPSKITTLVKVDKATLIEYILTFRNYSENPLLENMTQFYHANKWSRVTTSHGQTLLSLAFNYGILSMMTLTFGTNKRNIELVDEPVGCMGSATESQKIRTIRRLLMRDFRSTDNITLIDEERVCHEVVVGINGYGHFKDRCYFKDPLSFKIRVEDDADSNFWLQLLYALLVIIKFALLLCGPSLFITTVESMAQDNVPYVVKLKDTLIKTICIAQKGTQLCTNITFKHVVDLRTKKGFPKLKDAASDVIPGKPTKVKFSQYDITVDYKRMLTENIVNVGLLDSLFRAIFKCKIRNVGPFQNCCKMNMLAGCACAKKKPLPWIKFFRKFSNGILVVFIPFPYYLRLLIFYVCEYEEVMARKAIIKQNELSETYENSMIHYFTPTHPLFVIIYVIYGIMACMLAFMSRKQNEGRLLKIIVGAFRDLKNLNWTETLSMVVSNMLWPFKHFGLLGFLVGMVYWPIAIPFTILIALIYSLPTVYLTVRMIFYSKSAIIERARKRKKNKPYQVSVKTDQDMHKFEADALLEKSRIVETPSLDENNDDLGLDDIDNINPKEHFKNLKDNISLASSILKYQATNWRRFTVYVFSAMLCIATLYSVVIVMAEVIGCLIEIIVFTIMGIIVNASTMLRYVMLIMMILIYSADCFNNMGKKYLKLNKALFNEVKGRIKDIAEVTSLPSFMQENRGFKSQELGEQAEYESPDDLAEKPMNHWLINDLVLFIDSEDMPRIPRQLFDEVCQIRVAGVPGPVFRGLIEAFESFIKAVLFVLFVFIIVLTFGAVYKISSTNQTLATVLGGLLPMILRTFLAPPTPDVELGTVSFKSKLDEVIKNFCQKWPIYDFPFQVLPEDDGKDKTAADGTEQPSSAETKEENKTSPSTQVECVSPPPAQPPSFIDYMTAYARFDAEAGGMVGEVYNSNNNAPEYSPSVPESPKSPTVEKSVRIAEQPVENEVDILIYLPDKYDDVWLDEWSDILSRTSKTHVNGV